jgi:hypothetical protein
MDHVDLLHCSNKELEIQVLEQHCDDELEFRVCKSGTSGYQLHPLTNVEAGVFCSLQMKFHLMPTHCLVALLEESKC